jgi:hypothetical protein
VGRKKDKAEPRAGIDKALELDSLEPAVQKAALDLGFKHRASVNKIARGVDHERKGYKLALGFTVVVGIATVAMFASSFFAAKDSRGAQRGIALFALLWTVAAGAYARRFKRRWQEFVVLDEIVKTKLGR